MEGLEVPVRVGGLEVPVRVGGPEVPVRVGGLENPAKVAKNLYYFYFQSVVVFVPSGFVVDLS